MNTATKSRESGYADELKARHFADVMLSILSDYIPDAARRDAWSHLAKMAMDRKFELTDWQVRKEYEAWKSTQLFGLDLPPPPIDQR